MSRDVFKFIIGVILLLTTIIVIMPWLGWAIHEYMMWVRGILR